MRELAREGAINVQVAGPLAPTRVCSFTALVVGPEPAGRRLLVAGLRRVGATDVAEASSADQARGATRSGRPRDLCVVDLSLPGGALDLVAYLRNSGWQRLLVVAVAADPFSLRAAFVAGAHGYLLDRGGQPSLTQLTGQPGLHIPAPRLPSERMSQHAIPQQPSSQHALRPTGKAPARGDLSAREIQVLRLVAAGRSNNAAAEQLQLSALTVKSHLARIGRKLGTGDRAHMVALAMRGGLIS